jgi:predicted double-glycine peptidase
MLGYFIPLALVLLYVVANQYPALAFTAPVSWLMRGRNKFALFGFMAAMLLTTPLLRLQRKRDRIVVSVLIFVIVGLVSVGPFLMPALDRSYLLRLETKIDTDGICRQSDSYNCGPASAVTALRKLGLHAEIGEIAILTHANSLTGTDPDVIAQALQERYGQEGLVAEFRLFKDLDELKSAGLALVVIDFDFLTDHAVTVLEINDREVVVGDPLSGLAKMSHEEFLTKWCHCGVVLRLKPKV